VQSLLVKGFVFEKSKWIHFAPFIICFVITELSYLLQPTEVQLKLRHGLEVNTILQFFTWTGFKWKTIFAAGVDAHFVMWVLILGIFSMGFVLSIQKLSRAKPLEVEE